MTTDICDLKSFKESVDPDVWNVLQSMEARDSWSVDDENDVVEAIITLIDNIDDIENHELILQSAGWLSSPRSIAMLSTITDRHPEIMEKLRHSDSSAPIEVVRQRIDCLRKQKALVSIFSPETIKSTCQYLQEYVDRRSKI